MKTISTLIVTSVFLMAVWNCSDKQSNEFEDLNYLVTKEDHTQGYNYSADGYYYEYIFKSYTETIEDIEGFLVKLHQDNIIVLDAWYLEGSSTCRELDVVVKPVFIIHVTEKDEKIIANNFIFTPTPPQIFCGYYIKKYTLKI